MYLSEIGVGDLTAEYAEKIVFDGINEAPHKSGYAILLGSAPEYAFIRAKIAASFYKQGCTESIIASGSAASDKSVTECSVLRGQLIRLGVPKEAIIEEPHADDTIQNMTCSLTEICKRTDIMQVESITVITEPFHLKRALCLAKILLPRFISVYGYTEGTAEQRERWKSDERLNNCVKNEVKILKQLIEKGRIPDIKI